MTDKYVTRLIKILKSLSRNVYISRIEDVLLCVGNVVEYTFRCSNNMSKITQRETRWIILLH